MNEFDLSKLRAPKKDEGTNGKAPTEQNTAPVQVEIVHTNPIQAAVQGTYVWLLGAWLLKVSFKALHTNHPKIPLISYRDACFGLLALGTISENMRPTPQYVVKKKD